ncbi:hypothetical protein [Methylomagnum sp.]
MVARAGELEAALKAGRPMAEVRQAMEALAPTLGELVAGLRSWLADAETNGGAGDDIDWGLARLEALLEIDDMATNAAYREAAPILRAALGGAADTMERLIGAFDYDGALKVLRAAIAAEPRLRDG